MNASTIDWPMLERAVGGEVLRPGAAGYEAARRPAIARFPDARPAAVVRCRTPRDIAATLGFAQRTGLPVAAGGGGHCFAGQSSTDGIVVDLGPMAAVDVRDGIATIGAGARLGAIYDALDAHGRTIAGGCGPRVGIAGLALGGGLGLLGRRHGLTSDSLAGAEPVSQVLAHGSYRRTKRDLAGTADDDPLEHDHVVSRSEFFAGPLPAPAIAALVEHLGAGRRPGERRELDFTPMGGAYGRVPAGATAFVHRDARFLLKHAVVTPLDTAYEERRAARDWLERSYAIVHAHGTGGAYQNFAEDGREDWARAYYGDNLERLVAIRERYDPDDVLRSPQSIGTRAARPIG